MKSPFPVDHRPWLLPSGPWFMHQSWSDLLFAHWPVRFEHLRELIPPGLELETFDGYAWIGVVPFRMHNIHLRGLPPVPYTSAFAELNVRTYVTAGDKPGVFFFSLDAANRMAVMMARRFFYLPYFNAEMRVEQQGKTYHYVSLRKDRRGADVSFEASYAPLSPAFISSPGTFEHWLTERYCLYTMDNGQNIVRGEIHHAPWTLHRAELDVQMNTMVTGQGIKIAAREPVLHFSKQLDVHIWPLKKV
jgi:uncharacterized protein YqjF (DUF2071 family)